MPTKCFERAAHVQPAIPVADRQTIFDAVRRQVAANLAAPPKTSYPQGRTQAGGLSGVAAMRPVSMDSIRNLEQIQERENRGGNSRLGTLVVASLAGACIVFAVVALMRKPQNTKTVRPDPLSELAGKASPASSRPAGVVGRDMSFPDLLSDSPNPTTAMATLGTSASASASAVALLPPGSPNEPPPATDKLPVVPLPARNVIGITPVVSQPRDPLTAIANHASTPTGPEVAEGASGGYQLQVSSFRLQEEATRFASALRQRGHRAHVEAALVPGKGNWYRVRIGPFKMKLDALKYRREFEQREHMVPFLVEPPDKNAVARKVKLPRNVD